MNEGRDGEGNKGKRKKKKDWKRLRMSHCTVVIIPMQLIMSASIYPPMHRWPLS